MPVLFTFEFNLVIFDPMIMKSLVNLGGQPESGADAGENLRGGYCRAAAEGSE